MLDFLFSYGGYAPHGYCIAWDPLVLWSHIGADAVIALSYFAIPALIVNFVRRRGEPTLHAPAMMFALFITFCGLSHVAGIITFFYPAYGLQAVIKVATALISIATAVLTISLWPAILRLPAPGELSTALDAHRDEHCQRRAAEDELRATLGELQTANDELRELSYAASHDLKSPSIAVLYWLECFAEEHGDRLTPETLAEFQQVAAHVRRMSQQTADIFEFSQLLSATFDPPVPVNLTEIADRSRAGLEDRIAEKSATVRIDPLPEVGGHPRAVRLMFDNLLSNALKFQSGAHPPRVHIGWRAGETDSVTLFVEDNGIGIPARDAQRVFRLFSRLNLAEEYEGSGMGLALCRRVAAMHGGRIWIEHPEDGGTRICMSIRRAERSTQEIAARAA